MSGPLLDLDQPAKRDQLPGPVRVLGIAAKDLLDGASRTTPNRFQLRDRTPSPHDREPLPPMLDGVEEVSKVTGGVGGTHFGHEIRLSDFRSPPRESDPSRSAHVGGPESGLLARSRLGDDLTPVTH